MIAVTSLLEESLAFCNTPYRSHWHLVHSEMELESGFPCRSHHSNSKTCCFFLISHELLQLRISTVSIFNIPKHQGKGKTKIRKLYFY